MSYNVVRNSVIFDPPIMCQENVGVLQSKLKKLLTHLMKLKLFQPQFCDKVMQEFLEFVVHEMKLYSDVFQSFKRDKRSFDVFFFSYTDIVKYKELSSLVKMILTLSQGQAAVERGFSTNNSLCKVNISEQFLVCKKIVRDHLILNQLKPHTVPITNQIMRSVALARQKYNESLENKKNDREKENCSNEKKKITEEIAVVTQKYEQFQKLYQTLDSEFVSAIKLEEEKNDMTLVVKGNALKKRSEEAFEDAKKLQETIVFCFFYIYCL